MGGEGHKRRGRVARVLGDFWERRESPRGYPCDTHDS